MTVETPCLQMSVLKSDTYLDVSSAEKQKIPYLILIGKSGKSLLF